MADQLQRDGYTGPIPLLYCHPGETWTTAQKPFFGTKRPE
jgi:hypothetical protein